MAPGTDSVPWLAGGGGPRAVLSGTTQPGTDWISHTPLALGGTTGPLWVTGLLQGTALMPDALKTQASFHSFRFPFVWSGHIDSIEFMKEDTELWATILL